ncbi:MAG: hypothetical protein IIC07_00240 [Proteobacteria bacterium]|nr:hypothetical protein [Pseudomonadota bacterium]
MVNTLIKGALLGVFGYLWYWLGTAAPEIGSGTDSVSTAYMAFTVVAAYLLASK